MNTILFFKKKNLEYLRQQGQKKWIVVIFLNSLTNLEEKTNKSATKIEVKWNM